MSRNSIKPHFQRYSKGPLYSEMELHDVVQTLARDGYVKVEDNTTLGVSVYSKTEGGKQTGNATIYLDSLGCDPLNSGIMFISDEKGARGTTVWEMAHGARCAEGGSWNPLTRIMRRIF